MVSAPSFLNLGSCVNNRTEHIWPTLSVSCCRTHFVFRARLRLLSDGDWVGHCAQTDRKTAYKNGDKVSMYYAPRRMGPSLTLPATVAFLCSSTLEWEWSLRDGTLGAWTCALERKQNCFHRGLATGSVGHPYSWKRCSSYVLRWLKGWVLELDAHGAQIFYLIRNKFRCWINGHWWRHREGRVVKGWCCCRLNKFCPLLCLRSSRNSRRNTHRPAGDSFFRESPK